MKFNKLELFLIKLLKLSPTQSSVKLFNKAFNYKTKLMSNANGEMNQPQNNEKNAKNNKLNQPSEQSETGKGKKVIWTVIVVLLIIAFFALIILSGFTFQATQIDVKDVIAGPENNYTIELQDGSKKQIPLNVQPSFYEVTNSSFEVTYGTSAFSSFYYTGKISRNYPLNGEIQPFVLIVANYLINPSNGKVYNQNQNGAYTEDPKLVDFGKLFKVYSSTHSTTKPAPYSFATVTSIILSIMPILVIFGFLWWSMKRMGGAAGGGQDNVFSIGKSQAKLAQSNVLFSDVAGIEEEKEELIEIVDYLKRPEKYATMGARVPKGVILYGPPGTGKTLLAKAVAGEAQVPFFQVSGSAFEDMLVGVGAKRVRDLFSKAVKAAPAIIFIDEIDSVGSKRGKLETTSGSLADQTLNQLLAEMDGFSPRSGVIVIAATNRLDVLDDALLRPGRFDRHIRVNLPDIKERTAILKIHSRNKNISSSVDLEDIARRTPGFSGAQLENVLNEATILAVRKNKTSITLSDLDEAIDRVIAGPAKKTRVISLDEKRQIAYHEAGHAIVGLYTKGSEVVEKITIIPRGQAAGYTLSVPEVQELSIQKRSDLMGMVAGLLGGRASEEIIFGKSEVSTGAANDLYKATNIVRAMVTQLGMSSVGMSQYYPSEGVNNPYQTKTFSEQTALMIDKEIEKIFKERYEYASKIIKNNKKELDLIVESLLLLETIVKPQIDYIHKYKNFLKKL